MKALSDIIPLIVFFLTYKLYDLITATFALILATIVVCGVLYLLYKQKPSKMIIASTAIMLLMGSISAYTQNTEFIKMKPTILYIACALLLLIGMFFKKLFIKAVFSNVFNLDNKQWLKISWYWIVLFCTSAMINEFTWRFISEQAWIYLKVGVMPIVLMVFISVQLYYYRAHIKHEIMKR